jgi:antitoxin HigA-1
MCRRVGSMRSCTATRAISPDTALRLSRALGTSDRFWMNLQTRYDLDVQLEVHRDELDRLS